MNIIYPTQFSTIFSILTCPTSVFIIPTFQRPYTWDARQINDLLDDMTKASRLGGVHYLSTFHLIKCNLLDFKNGHPIFLDTVNNNDLKVLQTQTTTSGILVDHLSRPIKLYMIVDGQQRLTSLFLLAHLYASLHNPGLNSLLYVTLPGGIQISRLIQNPWKDHTFLSNLFSSIRTSSLGSLIPRSQSQTRLLDNTNLMQSWAKANPNEFAFLASGNFQASVIELHASFGLTSFMTLNDRGKSLTHLEKLKSLLLEYAFSIGGATLISKLHTAFGALYSTLDLCIHCDLFEKGQNGDDQLVRLLSCYLRLQTHPNAIWEGAQAAYENYFRAQLLAAAPSPSTVNTVITNWLNGIDEVVNQLAALEGYLSGRLGSCPGSSIHYGHHGHTLSDDYRAVLLSLRLQPHFLALLLKFRALYSIDWHDRRPIATHSISTTIPNLISKEITGIQAKLTGIATPPGLTKYLNDLSSYGWEPRPAISMLEVVERMQILNWNMGARWNATFVNYCHSTFGLSVNDFIQQWATWCSPKDFIENIIYSHFNEPNLKYLLKEQERSLGSNNLHSNLPPSIATSGLELEHIFAQNVDTDPHFISLGGFPAFAITDRADFDDNVLWRSGNIIWLSKGCNTTIGNWSPDLKAGHYSSCSGHPAGSGNNISSTIRTVNKLGHDLSSLGINYSVYRSYIEARCIELAIFGFDRF